MHFWEEIRRTAEQKAPINLILVLYSVMELIICRLSENGWEMTWLQGIIDDAYY